MQLLLLLVLLHQLILKSCHFLLTVLRTEVLVLAQIRISVRHEFLRCAKDHLLALKIHAWLGLLVVLVYVSSHLPSHAWLLFILVTINLAIKIV
jgi:hypothetical protein